jgi:hypothetical protein
VGKFKGKISIRTNSTLAVTDVIYKVHVLSGELKYPEDRTSFGTGMKTGSVSS